MSILSRNSPRKTRSKKEKPRTGETKTPVLGPVIKKPEQAKEAKIIDNNQMLEEYRYKPVPVPAPEPEQLNRAHEVHEALEAHRVPALAGSFGLYDLSFFCEERIHMTIFEPKGLKEWKTRQLNIDFIRDRLELYSEYNQEVSIGNFKDLMYYIKGEVLVPEEFINITGFMRKFLNITKVYILYETGEILLKDCEFCNFWLERASRFFEPVNIPLDRCRMQDEDMCLDCNLTCIFRQKTNG